jgi:hypothetical protein
MADAVAIRKEEIMSQWLTHWIQNQKQTGRFHPSWILLAVVVTIVIAGIVWIPAAVVAKADRYERLPAADLNAPGETAVPAGDLPAPAQAGPKIIRVDLSAHIGIV